VTALATKAVRAAAAGQLRVWEVVGTEAELDAARRQGEAVGPQRAATLVASALPTLNGLSEIAIAPAFEFSPADPLRL
jgi:hypothetical protein